MLTFFLSFIPFSHMILPDINSSNTGLPNWKEKKSFFLELLATDSDYLPTYLVACMLVSASW